jgi:monofunctional glycosyltransferase
MLETPPQTPVRPWRARAKKALIVLALAPFVLSLFYAVLPPPVTTLMLWKVWGRGIDYRWVSIEEMSPALPKAVLAAEDTRFCLNGAIDWESVSDALEDDDGPRRGASTITMQLAKNLFLWPGRSYVRKALEAPIAIWIDLMWSKQRVLEVYLNVAEFGPGIYGAEAAARYHFKKPASKLTGRESALLAAVLPNPIKRVAGKPSPGVRRYAARIAGRVSGTIPFLSCLDIKGL